MAHVKFRIIALAFTPQRFCLDFLSQTANNLSHKSLRSSVPKIVRPIGEFAEAMDYLEMIDISAGGKQQTDILCFNA
jgi:hypothetical protein